MNFASKFMLDDQLPILNWFPTQEVQNFLGNYLDIKNRVLTQDTGPDKIPLDVPQNLSIGLSPILVNLLTAAWKGNVSNAYVRFGLYALNSRIQKIVYLRHNITSSASCGPRVNFRAYYQKVITKRKVILIDLPDYLSALWWVLVIVWLVI